MASHLADSTARNTGSIGSTGTTSIVSSVEGMMFTVVTAMLAFVTVVFPNSMRAASFPLFVASAGLALFGVRDVRFNSRVLVWIAASTVTMFYVAIGWYQRPSEAAWQVPFAYVASPGMWLLICSAVLERYPLQKPVSVLLACGACAAVSVFAFYYIYFNVGPDSLRWLMSEPNIEFRSGKAAATMYVFGSLMFISGGFFAAPHTIRDPAVRFVFALMLAVAALLSGRSALMLSIALGLAVFALAAARQAALPGRVRQALRFGGSLLLVAAGVAGVAGMLGLELETILGGVAGKISAGGGEERVDQFHQLLEGIAHTWGLGAGHGIGVPLVRDEQYPWRYELLWLAMVYRVGIVGAMVYCIPMAVITFRYLRLLKARANGVFDDFMFGGFLAAFIGSATNPYYESFEFQWMLALPFVYFVLFGQARRNGGA